MTPPAKMENIGENIGPVMNIFCGYIIKCEAQIKILGNHLDYGGTIPLCIRYYDQFWPIYIRQLTTRLLCNWNVEFHWISDGKSLVKITQTRCFQVWRKK